jgi:hypothetical protein
VPESESFKVRAGNEYLPSRIGTDTVGQERIWIFYKFVDQNSLKTVAKVQRANLDWVKENIYFELGDRSVNEER